MRNIRLACFAILAIALMPAVSEARSRWSVSVGYSSGGYHRHHGGGIGYGYSYGYRPSFIGGRYHGGYGYSRHVYAPVVYQPVYYEPAYCAPVRYVEPVYYRTPNYGGYSYSTPRFYDRDYSYVSVSYSSGYRGRSYDRGYTYVDRSYSYSRGGRDYGYSSYYRR